MPLELSIMIGFYIVIIAGFVQILTHESMHVLMSKAFVKTTVLRFRPWPHVWGGRFYLGRVEMSYAEALPPLERCYVHAAPQLCSIALLVIYCVLGSWFLYATVCPVFELFWWFLCAITKRTFNDGEQCTLLWHLKDVTTDVTNTTRYPGA